jgi:hypothetical protein
MSDPVTNAEVEDVLSSIRRLVSEDKRPVQVAKTEPQKAVFRHTDLKQPEPKKDRLVLTPALRVTDAPSGTPSSDTDADARLDINNLVANDTPIDVFAPRAVATPDARSDGDDADALAFEDVTEEELFDDPAHDYSTDPYSFDDDADDDGDGVEGNFLQNSTTQPGPDNDLGDVSSDDFADESAEVSETAILKQPLQGEQKTSASDAEHATSPTPKGLTMGSSIASEKSIALTAKIAALETAIGQISETWEPDDAGESDYAGSEAEAMAWEDDAPEQPTQSKPLEFDKERQQSAEPEEAETLEVMEAQLEEFFAKSEPVKETPSAPEPKAESPTADVQGGEPTAAFPSKDGLEFPAEEQLIDEEVLRDLVSDIVRAELQGALGERITRNVRKLVRREIHRALAAQELE